MNNEVIDVQELSDNEIRKYYVDIYNRIKDLKKQVFINSLNLIPETVLGTISGYYFHLSHYQEKIWLVPIFLCSTFAFKSLDDVLTVREELNLVRFNTYNLNMIEEAKKRKLTK